MASYSVVTTKDNLSSLIDKALAGEEVVITRHGKPVVALRAVNEPKPRKLDKAEWLERLAKQRASGPQLRISAADLIREMRDEGIG